MSWCKQEVTLTLRVEPNRYDNCQVSNLCYFKEFFSKLSGNHFPLHLNIHINVKFQSPEPPKTVVWYRNGAMVNTLLKRGGISVVTESRRRTSNLLISKVTKADAGNYTCAPSNAQAHSVMVHVIEGM